MKFNAGLKYIGNSAFALSNAHTEQVLEIPASVIYIGPYAFNFRQYQDVYFYGEKAPLMPLGSYKLDTNTKDLGTAFPQQTLNGNNGFDPLPKEGEEITGDDTKSGYANRENYKNHGVYLCMLHYPKELSDENRDTYTDITRVYKTYRTDDGKFIASDTGTDEATDKVGKEEKNRRQQDQKTCCSKNDLALHPIAPQMETMRTNIIPGQKTNSSGHNQQHDNSVNQRIGNVRCQRWIEVAGTSQNVKTGIAECGNRMEYRHPNPPGTIIAAENRQHGQRTQ